MPSGPMYPWTTGAFPAAGTCPACSQVAGGERCTHCGVAVRVGPYRVRRVMGQRGASRTYLADDTDGPIVLKELSFNSEPEPAVLQAFHQEARQLQSLTHPRVPRYMDLLQLGLGAQMRLYLVQEFIEGMPLEAELAIRHVTELEAREMARQVLDILRYLQGRSPQVFHGDLKPANLVRRPDGALFLVDFGAGWVRGRASPGAAHYTPPEQAGGELDATTDLFALGITLMEALSWATDGKLHQATPSQLVSRLEVGRDFREFLGRLASSNPALRFASAESALRVLETPAQPRSSRPLNAKRVAVAAAASVLLFGSGFVTGRLTQAPMYMGAPPLMETAAPTKRLPPRPPSRPSDAASTVPPSSQATEEWALDHQPLGCDFAYKGVASASASSVGGTPEGAFDHDAGTLWHTPQSNNAWLQVNLGQSHLLNALVLDWTWDTHSSTKAEASVMTSVDGVHWSHLLFIPSTLADNNGPRRMWFPQRVARYVRFAGSESNKSWAFVRSLELYGPDCPLTPSPGHAPSRLSKDSLDF